jgi:hypothetical protein
MSLTKVREYESSKDVEGLIRLLEDSDADVRFKSAQALGLVGGNQLELLLDALKSENPLVRWGAAYALGGVKDPKSVSYLKKALKSEVSGHIRKWIIYALGEIGGEEVIDPLLDAVKRKRKGRGGIEAKSGATHALGYIGGPESVPILKKETSSTYPFHKAESKWAVGKIEYDLSYKKPEQIPQIQVATANFTALNLTPAESYLTRVYQFHDKDDVGEFMMIYTLLDLMIRGGITSCIHTKAKKKGLFGKKEDIEEVVILKKGENLDNLDLKPHEKEIVDYIEDKGTKLLVMAHLMDDDRVGAKFREDGLRYLAGRDYFDKGGDFKSTDIEITEEGSKVSATILEALNEGQNLRIWFKDAPNLAYEYIKNVRGLLLLKRLCFAYDDEVTRLNRKIEEAKTEEEKLLCYYWVAEGLKSSFSRL